LDDGLRGVKRGLIVFQCPIAAVLTPAMLMILTDRWG
jgi:hypothetical protein